MSGVLEVLNPGLGNGIQDAGRFGYRHMGITVSGCLDRPLARCVNALAGNAADAACIEVRVMGPALKVVQGPVCLAVAGNMVPKVRRADGRQEEAPAWRSVTLDVGDVLETGTVRGGVAYITVGGGFDTPVQLGSRSTYQRALIGGIDGRLLAKGDSLPCGVPAVPPQGERHAAPWRYDESPIRVILGPQQEHFTAEALQEFVNSAYTVTPQMDRMGMRLDGPPLKHVTPEAADIVSDGVTPGVIQVPGNGQPIILLADCQTVGGYPKIATVISADLPRLAQRKPGDVLRFRAVDAAEAKAALLDLESRWRAWADTLVQETTDDDAAWAAI
jgi:allophanate hydrolase